jgi:hypothetical protein
MKVKIVRFTEKQDDCQHVEALRYLHRRDGRERMEYVQSAYQYSGNARYVLLSYAFPIIQCKDCRAILGVRPNEPGISAPAPVYGTDALEGVVLAETRHVIEEWEEQVDD